MAQLGTTRRSHCSACTAGDVARSIAPGPCHRPCATQLPRRALPAAGGRGRGGGALPGLAGKRCCHVSPSRGRALLLPHPAGSPRAAGRRRVHATLAACLRRPPCRHRKCPPPPSPSFPPLQNVVNRAKRAVPYPLLGENTLVLSDLLCVRPAKGGRGGAMELVCRCAAAAARGALAPCVLLPRAGGSAPVLRLLARCWAGGSFMLSKPSSHCLPTHPIPPAALTSPPHPPHPACRSAFPLPLCLQGG